MDVVRIRFTVVIMRIRCGCCEDQVYSSYHEDQVWIL